MAKKTVAINARISEKQYDKMKQLADEQDETLSAIIRYIIDEYFKSKETE